MTDTQIFDADGRAIPFAVEGDGPALVLIAGLGLGIDYLGALAHSVSEEDFRVIRLGTRRVPSDPSASVTMSQLAQDVVDVLDELGIADAWIGGHEFGGAVARIVALEHADRVNGVLLLGVDEPASSPGAVEAPEHLRDDAVAQMQRSARGAAQLPPLAPAIPVLVIQGTEDPVAPAANGDALQVAAPDRVSVVRVEGGGHLFPATHVGATSWAIEDYLDWD
ncbi:alpha/beta hydrolase [Microbacterium limosum]|uniref:Alpha/beta hydrolase n=1 Tax=Microbacterium limosum TaxID=3079935 RepID=A0AAU0MEG0_9MICO|nr:alpha/beta hydrolase [Microbacterium sp. Y20]WOQ68915.1 alpha/beta hydrolase [Microbacterium sp. Y20]